MSLAEQLESKEREITNLQRQFDEFLDSSKEMEAELEKSLQDTQLKLEDALKRKSAIDDKCNQYQEKNSQLSRDNSKLSTDLVKAKDRFIELESLKKEMEASNEDLLIKVRILQVSEEDLQHKLANCEEDIYFLQTDLDEIKLSSSAREARLQSEITALQSELENRMQSHSNLSADYKCKAREEDLDTDGSQVERLGARLAEAELQNQELSEELSKMSDELMALHGQRKNSGGINSSQASEFLNEKILLQSRIEQLEQELADTENNVTELSGELEQIQDELLGKSSQLDELKSNLSSARSSESTLKLLVEELKGQVLNGEKEVLEIQDMFHSISAELEQSSRSVSLQENFLHQKDLEIKALEEKNVKLEASLAELSADLSAKGRISIARSVIITEEMPIGQVNDNLASEIAALKEEKQSLYLEVETLRSTVDRLSKELLTAQSMLRQAMATSGHGHNAAKERPSDSTTATHSLASSDLLESATSFKKSMKHAISSNNVDVMKMELFRQMKRYEEMRVNNAKLLQNLTDIKGNIQVCCRARPPTAYELEKGGKICVDVVDDNEIVCYNRRDESWRSFFFDKAWQFDASQSDVFADIEPLTLSVIDGYNACIFAYGQTGSGKTWTMNGYGSEYGVSYRTLHKIFEMLDLRQSKSGSQHSKRESKISSSNGPPAPETSEDPINLDSVNTNGISSKSDSTDGAKVTPFDDEEWGVVGYADNSFSYTVEVSMMEIYNEQVRDLLAGSEGMSQNLDIKQSADGGVNVSGLKDVPVKTLDDVMEVFAKGSSNRSTTSTSMNEHSSRSHLILMVNVTTTKGDSPPVKGKLHLVDLAGSERVAKSGVTGVAMKEAQFINKSLSALGDVMEALDQKSKHIPYRNSKLTYLLQDSLGGSSKTMMIVTVCPTEVHSDETLFALQFASRVRNIQLGSGLTARRHDTTKNLEEALKALKGEVKESKRKRTLAEESLLELKKEHKKMQDKYALQLDSKSKSVDEIKKTNDNQLQMVTKQYHDLQAKLCEEKENRQQLNQEIENLQRTCKKSQESMKELTKEKEKLAKLLESGSRDRDHVGHAATAAGSTDQSNVGILRSSTAGGLKRSTNNLQQSQPQTTIASVSSRTKSGITSRMSLPGYQVSTPVSSSNTASSRKPPASVGRFSADTWSASAKKKSSASMPGVITTTPVIGKSKSASPSVETFTTPSKLLSSSLTPLTMPGQEAASISGLQTEPIQLSSVLSNSPTPASTSTSLTNKSTPSGSSANSRIARFSTGGLSRQSSAGSSSQSVAHQHISSSLVQAPISEASMSSDVPGTPLSSALSQMRSSIASRSKDALRAHQDRMEKRRSLYGN